MRTLQTRYILFTAAIVILLAVMAITINSLSNHYPGNDYFPANTLFYVFALLLTYSGFSLQFGHKSKPAIVTKNMIYFFIVMAIVALATNAAQYTPFSPIDKHILSFEQSFSIHIETIVAWTNTHPELKKILQSTYDSLPYQMCYIPLIIIVMGQEKLIREYYFLLLFSVLIGFSFYYFFPTTAPASIVDSSNFSTSQQATGLKFLQIHNHIQPTTLEGGMIALPSFHVIWAWFCVYLLRGWPLAFLIMLPVNLLLVLSCVLLGWHYPTDILGSVIVIFLAHRVYAFYQLGTICATHSSEQLGANPDRNESSVAFNTSRMLNAGIRLRGLVVGWTKERSDVSTGSEK